MEKQCENPAFFRYTWPGRDESYICLECAEKVMGLAQAMGLYLQLVRYQPEGGTLEWESCKQKKRVD